MGEVISGATVAVAWLLCNLYLMGFLYELLKMVLGRFFSKRDHQPLDSGLEVMKIRREWEYDETETLVS